MSEVNLSYTNRDMEKARQEAMRQIPILSQGQWTDMNPTDPGVVLLDYVHALVDMMQFYQDHQALETYMSRSRERKNILSLAKQYSYKAKSAAGSKVDLLFSSESTLNNNVVIPMYTKVNASLRDRTITFVTMKEAVLYPGHTEVSIPAIQGELSTFEYTGTGRKDQVIEIPDTSIDTGVFLVMDDTQEIWSEIDFIFYADPNAKNYELNLTPDNRIAIKLGGGNRGRVLTPEDKLTITYLRTLGADGNVGSNKITSIVGGSLLDSQGNNVTMRVTNPQPSSGGAASQSNQSIKEQSPAVLKTVWRAVMSEDFEVLAKEVNGVANAKALDIRNSPDLCLHHEVKVLIVPEGGSAPTSALKDEVFNFLYPRTIPPTVLQIIDPVYKDIDMDISVAIDNRFLKEEVEYYIKQAIRDYLDSQQGFGQVIRYTTLISIISQTKGVRYLESLSIKEDIVLSKIELARLGTISVSVTKEV